MLVVLLLNKWLLSLFLLGANVHPYHVSATEMEYDAKAKRVEISTKIFTDDFEDILAKRYKQKIDLGDKNLRPKMTELVFKYLNSHLSIQNNGKQLPLKLYGWEIDHEAVLIYTTADVTNFNAKQITIQKTVLYDLFDDQLNIIHFIYNGKRKSTKLAYPETTAHISF